jgi:leucyl-tRNA synthetase
LFILIVSETPSPFTGKGILINSGKYNGLTSEQAIDAFLQEAKAGGYGHDYITYNLRDWLISRQRSKI